MAGRTKVGRNDPCPCGSGEKYKRCCEGKAQSNRMGHVMLVVLIGVVLGAIAVGITSFRGGPTANRVWDPDHGHYHTVP